MTTEEAWMREAADVPRRDLTDSQFEARIAEVEDLVLLAILARIAEVARGEPFTTLDLYPPE